MSDFRNEKEIVITVVGRTRAGKTTWISSLLKDSDTFSKMSEICKKNEDGQTKVLTEYELCAPTSEKSIFVTEIVLEDKYEELSENERKKVDGLILPFVENTEPEQGEGTLQLRVKADINVEDFLNKVINNKELQEMNVIRKVCICLAAAEEVWEYIRELELERVMIYDTRGLMDDLAAFKEYFSQNDQDQDSERTRRSKMNLGEFLMKERGFVDADGCVFMTRGFEGVEGNFKELYAAVFEQAATAMPTAIVARENILIQELKRLEKDKWISKYREWMDRNNVDENGFFKGEIELADAHMELRNLLNERFGLFRSGDDTTKTMLRKKHYRQLLLANVGNKSVQKAEEIYLISAREVFRIVLKEIYEYKKEMRDLIQRNKELPGMICAFYKKGHPDVFREDLKWLKDVDGVEFVAQHFRNSGVKGNLLGPRGGITPIKEHWAAVYLLKTAREEYEDLMNCFIDEWEKKAQNSEEKADGIRIYEFLHSLLRNKLDIRKTTPVMFDKDMIYSVFREVSKKIGDHAYPEEAVLKGYGEDVSIVYDALRIPMQITLQFEDSDIDTFFDSRK